MKDVRITVIRKVCHQDLMALYENPIEHACDMEEGRVFLSQKAQKPLGLCDSAWESMESFVVKLANGEGNFYDFIIILARLKTLGNFKEAVLES